MRLNKFLALTTNLSRRTADLAIEQGRVKVNGKPPKLGQKIGPEDAVTLDKVPVVNTQDKIVVMLNKPQRYICSRDGQGGKTIYDILPKQYHQLNPVGRLDKNSSGLLLLTNDGDLANKLTHPRYKKEKVYKVELNRPLPNHLQKQIEEGVMLEDGISQLKLNGQDKNWTITMHEGRNRQIRRTFEAIEYRVKNLHRIKFGKYTLDNLGPGNVKLC